MKLIKTPILVLAIGTALAGCGHDPYQPITDGPKSAAFKSDLAACRQVSLQKQKDNSDGIVNLRDMR